MPLTAAGRNALLTSGKAGFTHVSALTALTPTEAATTRQAVTWQAAGTPAAGQTGNTAALAIPIGAGVTIVGLAFYDALTVGNTLAILPYGSAGQVVTGVGTVVSIASDTIQSNGHGLTTDDRVFFGTVNGEALPAGLSATTLYFVRATGLTVDAFTVALTSGGAAVDITGLGEVSWFKSVPNTFASAGNINLGINALLLDLNFA